MLTEKIKTALQNNWGSKADALDCYAEIKFIDPLSSWACYIFSMNEYETMMDCLIYTKMFGPEISCMPVGYLQFAYNENGEAPIVDEEFRRIRVSELLKRLKNET